MIKNSTPQWRLEALHQHFTILQEVFTDEAIQLMYVDEAEFDYYDKSGGLPFGVLMSLICLLIYIMSQVNVRKGS